jgi:hypothetical protein
MKSKAELVDIIKYFKIADQIIVDFAARMGWQAGIIDGEGTVTISKQIRKGRPSPAYREIVQVSNTDRRIIIPFKQMWGGNFYQRPDKRKIKNWRDSYTWHCPMTKVPQFLKALLPFLRSKKEQALILLKFIEKKKSFKRKSLGQGKGSAPLSKKEIHFRESLCNQIRLLNTKGKYSRKQKGGDA